MNSRDVVTRTIRFEGSDRLPFDFPEPYGSDFIWVGMKPSPDDRPREGGYDEWGALWETFGFSQLGEVKDYPLKDWADFDSLAIPDVDEAYRWDDLEEACRNAGDRFILANGISIYERVHFIRGLENTWIDIHQDPDKLGELIDILVEMNLAAIQRYANTGAHGFIFCDDWGLQNRLMISPKAWRMIWKPRYARIFQAVHDAGLLTFLHSCGYIVDILDDLIEIGLDVVHMDQQENMGLDLLSDRFGGRLTFFAPVDIQQTLARGNPDEIRAYAHQMVNKLGIPGKDGFKFGGGFIPRWYSDPVGAGHSPQAVETMCESFRELGARI